MSHLSFVSSVFSACFPAPLCWTPCCLNQQNLKMPRFRTRCSMTLLTPSACVCSFMCFWKICNHFCGNLITYKHSVCHALCVFSAVMALWKVDTSWSSGSSCRNTATVTPSPQMRRVSLMWKLSNSWFLVVFWFKVTVDVLAFQIQRSSWLSSCTTS